MTPKEVSEKLRVIVEQHKGEYTETFGLRISDMATDAADAIDSLQVFVDHITSLPSCNSCSILTCCVCRPAFGESVRYNCPGYTGPDRAGKNSKQPLISNHLVGWVNTAIKLGDMIGVDVGESIGAE